MGELEHTLIATLFMGGLGLLLAVALAVANRRLYVYEDPRIDEVDDMLPHANCGACGEPGCRTFAEKLITGDVIPGQCTVNSADLNQNIADYLGVDLGNVEKQIARLACAGGSNVALIQAGYEGLKTCRAASLISGGGKVCSWGCIGFGDCATVCDFDAIVLDRFGLPQVDEDKCTACGDCVDVCPKDLFSLQPESHHLWISCISLDNPDESEHECEVSCTACGRCAADAPEGLITMQNNLAVIDYQKNGLASKLPIERCPTGAIVWLEDEQIRKGVEAKKIIRKEPLPRT